MVLTQKETAAIQIEEQNHAKMLWKYKTVNGMTDEPATTSLS